MQMMGYARDTVIRVLILFVLLVASAPLAWADYAVLRSGARIHVTSYEAAGDRMRLYVPGGTMELPIDDIISIQPQDTFPADTAEPPSDGRYSTLIRAASLKHGVDEKLS
jgi:hypothetical protein